MKKFVKKDELKFNRHYKKMRNSNNYVKFHLSWCVRFNLSLLEVVIMKVINDCNYYEKGEKKYTGSVEKLCTITNTTLPTVRAALKKLHDMGFITHEEDRRTDSYGNTRNWICYKSNIDLNSDESLLSIEEQLERELEMRPYRERAKLQNKQQNRLSKI